MIEWQIIYTRFTSEGLNIFNIYYVTYSDQMKKIFFSISSGSATVYRSTLVLYLLFFILLYINNMRRWQGFVETALSIEVHGGMNITGLRLVDSSNQTAKAFYKAWQGQDSSKWSGGGHSRITVSGGHNLLRSFSRLQFLTCWNRSQGVGLTGPKAADPWGP